MPYMSAAEKRRLRALETAGVWDKATILDGFGLNERTGVGSRNPAPVGHSAPLSPAVPPRDDNRAVEESNLHRHAPLPPLQNAAPKPSSSPHRHHGPTVAVFDPNIFGDNATALRPQNSDGPSLTVTQHPLEYSDGDPSALTRPPVKGDINAIEEYYNRTHGPVLSDNDRAAIENFFATDDFTAQFNAQAAARRSELALAPVRPPPHRSPNRDVKYPVCHNCHAAIMMAQKPKHRAVEPQSSRTRHYPDGQRPQPLMKNVHSGPFR